MSERDTKQPVMEPRQASESVADMATQTEEEPAPEENRSLARTRSAGHPAQQSPAQERRVYRRPEEAVAPVGHHDRGGAPAVRLDMDLDVDIRLQAKIKGDIELSILDADQAREQRETRRH
ncbi:hypothetical protein VTI74DRAFT_9844 [Chaetomium olivicolor]